MSFLDSLRIAASSLTAQRQRMDAISSNIANAETTRTAEGGPYRRLEPRFEAARLEFGAALAEAEASSAPGVRVTEVQEDARPPRLVYDPAHPDADANGYVAMPNVSVVEEMVDMISASRSYEASATAVATVKSMAAAALEIGG